MTTHPPHCHVAECASTNDLARAWATDPHAPAPDGAWVTAERQTQGRGQRGRRWDAAPGESVLMSVVLRPALSPAERGQMAFVAALSVADVLDEYGVAPALKWPNDVLVGDKKMAGVLIETVPGPGDAGIVIAGIGVNVNQTVFPGEEAYWPPPVSLRQATGQAQAVPEVARRIADALRRRTAQRQADGWPPVLEAYRARLAQGTPLRRGAAQAELVDVAEDGSARVRLPDGTFAQWVSVGVEEGANSPANRV